VDMEDKGADGETFEFVRKMVHLHNVESAKKTTLLPPLLMPLKCYELQNSENVEKRLIGVWYCLSYIKSCNKLKLPKYYAAELERSRMLEVLREGRKREIWAELKQVVEEVWPECKECVERVEGEHALGPYGEELYKLKIPTNEEDTIPPPPHLDLRKTIRSTRFNPSLASSPISFDLWSHLRSTSDEDSTDAVALNALVSRKDKLGPGFSYSQIVKDPLVTLSISEECWRSLSLRKITLRLVEKFMRLNSERIRSEAKLKGEEEMAEKFIEARNVVTVKQLIQAVVEWGGNNRTDEYLPKSVINAITSQNPGTATLVVKSGVRESHLEWLVTNLNFDLPELKIVTTTFQSQPSASNLSILQKLALAYFGMALSSRSASPEAIACVEVSLSSMLSTILSQKGPLPVDDMYTYKNNEWVEKRELISSKVNMYICMVLKVSSRFENEEVRRVAVRCLARCLQNIGGELAKIGAGIGNEKSKVKEDMNRISKTIKGTLLALGVVVT